MGGRAATAFSCTVTISWAGCLEVARLPPEPLPPESLRALLTPQTAINVTPRSGQVRGKPFLAGAPQASAPSKALCAPTASL